LLYIAKSINLFPFLLQKEFRQTFEKMEGFCLVTPVTGLNRPNTGKEDDDAQVYHITWVILSLVIFAWFIVLKYGIIPVMVIAHIPKRQSHPLVAGVLDHETLFVNLTELMPETSFSVYRT